MTIAKNLKRTVVTAWLTAFCALGVAGQAEARGHHHKESKGRQAAQVIHAVADTIRAATGQPDVVVMPGGVAPVVRPGVVAPGVSMVPSTTVIVNDRGFRGTKNRVNVFGPHGRTTIYSDGTAVHEVNGRYRGTKNRVNVFGPHGRTTIYHSR